MHAQYNSLLDGMYLDRSLDDCALENFELINLEINFYQSIRNNKKHI